MPAGPAVTTIATLTAGTAHAAGSIATGVAEPPACAAGTTGRARPAATAGTAVAAVTVGPPNRPAQQICGLSKSSSADH